jgi:hypothetical protein
LQQLQKITKESHRLKGEKLHKRRDLGQSLMSWGLLEDAGVLQWVLFVILFEIWTHEPRELKSPASM